MAGKVLIQSRLNRIFHWSFALIVFLLLASGFYIHHPVSLGDVYNMQANILIQAAAGFIASGIFALWVYHYLVTGAHKDIRFKKRDMADFWGLLKYYFFMEKKSPHHGKYNAGQKLIYTSWFFVFVLMFLTGLILYSANFGSILPFPVTVQKVRFYHYLGALWFLGTVPVHIYLVMTEDPAKLQAIFTGWVRK